MHDICSAQFHVRWIYYHFNLCQRTKMEDSDVKRFCACQTLIWNLLKTNIKKVFWPTNGNCKRFRQCDLTFFSCSCVAFQNPFQPSINFSYIVLLHLKRSNHLTPDSHTLVTVVSFSKFNHTSIKTRWHYGTHWGSWKWPALQLAFLLRRDIYSSKKLQWLYIDSISIPLVSKSDDSNKVIGFKPLSRVVP